ncbi:MAG TPA: DNRLRE domain-containing protein, partial [Pirellulales bacterium]|nr:DNRLRE domain-containing protein [Pirellulales bacterium]
MNRLAGNLFGRKSKRRRLNHRRKLGVELLERRQLLTVVSLTPVKDNSLIEYQSPQYSGGASPTLFVGIEHFSLTRMRGLVDFNVAGSIPAGSTINSVTLTVTIELTNSTTTVTPTVELHDVLSNWGQGTGVPTYFMPPFAPTTTNDATWTNTFYPNQNWNTPGGDFSSTVSGTAVFGADGTTSTFNSTSQMAADVQSWLNNPSANFGWLMKGDETQNSGKMIGSMHSSNPPTLTIDYTAPVAAAPPDLVVSSSHTGSFRQGDSADQYTLTASNSGAGPTSGQVTVTDTLPTGLTPTAASGTGWSANISGSTVTATRSDALANGGSYPTLTLTVSVANNAPASVTNTAKVAGGGETNTTNDTANDPTTIIQAADLTIGMSHTGQFRQGDGADNYAITVNNIGPGPTSGLVTVTDTLPTGLTPTAAGGTGWNTNISGSTVTATRSDTLANGGSYPVLTLTVSVASNAPASVTNTAQVAGGGELITSNDTANDPTTITQVADLTITNSHTGNFRQGDRADAYTITVNNVGAGPTSGLVTVTDTLPTGLTPTAAGGTGWNTNISGSTVTATRSDALANGGSYPALTLTVSVANNAPASVTNSAKVAGGGETNISNDTASDPTTIIQAADLTIGVSHTGDFQQGASGDHYTVTVSNVGLGPTTGQVTVTDTLPTGLTPTAAGGTGWTTSITGSTVTATRSDALAQGAAYPVLTITVSVAANAPASVTNIVQVAGGGELNTANDSASDPTTITVPAPDLTISESHAGSFRQGDNADNYTITVNNVGLVSTTGQVTVTDTLPTGLTPTAASGTGWSTNISGSTVTATRSDALANGGSYPALTLTVSVANNAPASVINTAQVAGGGELNTTNDTASDPTTITQVADLTLTESHTGVFQQGDSADTYTITVNNVGPGPTTGLVT